MTDGMDEVAAVEVFEPVLVRIMGVRTTIEVVRGRVLTTFLVASILRKWLEHVEWEVWKDLRGNPPR